MVEVVNITIPRRLADLAKERGLDLEDIVINAVLSRLGLDPSEEYLVHVELAKHFLEEGKILADKDPVQASEKLYKAAEETIKALAIKLGLEEAKEALDKGRWLATLLFNAVDELSDRLNMKELRWWWESAWFLHVEGFHEARLSPGNVQRRVSDVELLVSLLDKLGTVS